MQTGASSIGESLPSYGPGGGLPFQATIEDGRADLGSGLLLRIQAAMLGLEDGQILRIASPLPVLAEQLRGFEAASGHGLLAVVPDPIRPGWRDHFVRKGPARTAWIPESGAVDGLVGAVDGSVGAPGIVDVEALMPRRLWLYTNYDCNLACDYCCVVAGPRADPRWLPADRLRRLVDEAVAAGFERVFITGGEPLLRPDLADLAAWITARLPLTLLTNAMLVRGRRWDELRPLVDAGRRITFQVSLDSATSELHDTHRGRGSHARALAGIRALLGAGAHVRLAATLPADRLGEIAGLEALADDLGIAPDDRIFRPIALRGAAEAGEPIRLEDVAPDLTADAVGWSWHPLSNDPDMRLGVGPDASLAEAVAAVRGRLEAIIADRAVRLDRFVCG